MLAWLWYSGCLLWKTVWNNAYLLCVLIKMKAGGREAEEGMSDVSVFRWVNLRQTKHLQNAMVKKQKTGKQNKIFQITLKFVSELNIRLNSVQKGGSLYIVSGFSFLRLNHHFWALAKSKPVPALLHGSNLTFWGSYSFYSDSPAESFVLHSPDTSWLQDISSFSVCTPAAFQALITVCFG